MEMTAGDILRNTKKINIALDTYLNERLASTDLTAAQGNVLFFILEHFGVHSTRIHKQLGISRGTVSGLIKKLREKGYVSFSSCDTDDRQKPILVTEKANALREALSGWQRELRRWSSATLPRRSGRPWGACRRRCCATSLRRLRA